MDIIKDYDVIMDCLDNAATRYLVNDCCVLLNKVLVSGAALRMEGQVSDVGVLGFCWGFVGLRITTIRVSGLV